MGNMIQKVRAKAQQFFGNLTKGQKIRLVVLTAVVLVIGVALYLVASYKPYSVLYTGMNASDAGEVLNVLEEMGISAKVQGADTVLIPSDQVDEVRMKLATQGYPESGYNYDIFKQASGLGTTDYEKKVYLQFQLQDNLRKTILKLNKVQDVVVNINMPEDSSFVISDGSKEATAAVMLTLKNGQTISSDEAKAIAELVSKSVSGLKVENVRIVDSKMHLYSLDDKDETQNIGTQLDLQNTVQSNLQKQVLGMLTPIFGDQGVVVQVGVTLNFDTTVSESISFAPPVAGQTEGLVVSMSELAEVVQNANGASGGVVGTSTNAADMYQSIVNGNANDVYKKVQRDVNYELNQTKTQIEGAKGKIEKLSVSVVLDSSSNSADYTSKVKNLVSTAIGVAPESVTVEMMPFKNMSSGGSESTFGNQAEILKQVQHAALIRTIVIAGASFLAFLIVVFTLKRIFGPKKIKAKRSNRKGKEVDLQVDEQIIPPPIQQSDLDDIEFNTKEDGNLDRVTKYIDKSPESVAHLLRTWLAEEYGR